MSIRISWAIFLDCAALPLGTLANDNQRIIAWVGILVLDKEPDQSFEIDLEFRDETTDGGDIRGVERCKSGVAAEDAKNTNPFMRCNSCPLTLYCVGGSGDCCREADTILGVANVVVHRLRNGDDLHAQFIKLGGVAECVVATDGDQLVDAQGREIVQDLPRKVPRLRCGAALAIE